MNLSIMPVRVFVMLYVYIVKYTNGINYLNQLLARLFVSCVYILCILHFPVLFTVFYCKKRTLIHIFQFVCFVCLCRGKINKHI